MGTDRPGREIPQDSRDVVQHQIDTLGWRYDASGKGHPRLYPADISKPMTTVPTTPGRPADSPEPRGSGTPLRRDLATREEGDPMTGYSVTVQVRPDAPAGLTDDQVDAVADRLSEHYGSFAADAAGGWAATFSVDAEDAQRATFLGLETTRSIAEASQLPAGEVVRLEAVRDDVVDEELAEPNYPDLVSGPEIAQILGVSRQRVHQLATEHVRFPAPLYRLGAGSLWVRQAIETFADGWERKPGRPRATITG